MIIFAECQDNKFGAVSLKEEPVAKWTSCSSETWSSGHENTTKSSVLKSTLYTKSSLAAYGLPSMK